jgi:hypothetical protein
MDFCGVVLLMALGLWMGYRFTVVMPHLEKARKNCSMHYDIPYQPLRDPGDFLATLTFAVLRPMYRR